MHRTLLRATAAALAITVVLAGAYALWEPAPRDVRLDRSYAANAVWARYLWFSGVSGPFDRNTSPYTSAASNRPAIPSEMIAAFADKLRDNRIRYAYIFTGSLDPSGTYPLWPLEDPRAPVSPSARFDLLRRRAPDLKVLAWVGGVHAGFKRGQMDVRDRTVRAAAAGLCARLVREAGFDGVHLNIEPTRNDDGAYIALLAEVRRALPRGKILSVAGPEVLPVVAPFRPFGNHFWNAAYTARVAARVDQIAFMTYDTFMPLGKLHRAFIRYQTRALVRATRAGNPTAEVLIGVPTYDEHNVSHVRHVETLDNTLRGVRAGLADLAEGPSPFAGVAIYASWTTDAREWAQYRVFWLGETPGSRVGMQREPPAR